MGETMKPCQFSVEEMVSFGVSLGYAPDGREMALAVSAVRRPEQDAVLRILCFVKSTDLWRPVVFDSAAKPPRSTDVVHYLVRLLRVPGEIIFDDTGLADHQACMDAACREYRPSLVRFALAYATPEGVLSAHYRDGRPFIRANHGHRFIVDHSAFLPAISSSDIGGPWRFAWHGTRLDVLNAIEIEGLRPMGQAAIYIQDKPGGVVPGKGRSRYIVHIVVDCAVAAAKRCGLNTPQPRGAY